MSQDRAKITDSVSAVLGKKTSKRKFGVPKLWVPRMAPHKIGIRGLVETKLFDSVGNLKYAEVGENLVTDYGDEHIARRIFDDAFDIVTGMRLGTGATAAAKSGAGAAIVTYITTSNEDLDAAATHSDKGAGLGYRATHVCTWIAGDITNGAIAEVVLSDETPLTNVAGVAGDTVARYVFGATIDKQAGDSLEVTWNLDILGA